MKIIQFEKPVRGRLINPGSYMVSEKTLAFAGVFHFLCMGLDCGLSCWPTPIALLHNPFLLIPDEPSKGLDPNGIIEIRELLKSLNKGSGLTIIFSSHLLSEVGKPVTHVGIIDKGKLLFQRSLEELRLMQHEKSVTSRYHQYPLL